MREHLLVEKQRQSVLARTALPGVIRFYLQITAAAIVQRTQI
jgi:hypothetical protein